MDKRSLFKLNTKDLIRNEKQVLFDDLSVQQLAYVMAGCEKYVHSCDVLEIGGEKDRISQVCDFLLSVGFLSHTAQS